MGSRDCTPRGVPPRFTLADCPADQSRTVTPTLKRRARLWLGVQRRIFHGKNHHERTPYEMAAGNGLIGPERMEGSRCVEMDMARMAEAVWRSPSLFALGGSRLVRRGKGPRCTGPDQTHGRLGSSAWRSIRDPKDMGEAISAQVWSLRTDRRAAQAELALLRLRRPYHSPTIHMFNVARRNLIADGMDELEATHKAADDAVAEFRGIAQARRRVRREAKHGPDTARFTWGITKRDAERIAKTIRTEMGRLRIERVLRDLGYSRRAIREMMPAARPKETTAALAKRMGWSTKRKAALRSEALWS